MATRRPLPPVPVCGICPEEPAESADMYCSDCQIFLCMRCFKSHKKTPVSKNHMYMSSEMAVETLQKDIDNKNFGPQKDNNEAKGKESVTGRVSKIITQGTLDKVMAGLSIRKQHWNIRFMEHNFRDVITRTKEIKRVQLSLHADRLGVVNGNIWVTNAVSTVTVINEQLLKVKKSLPEVSWIKAVQQISDTDVMLATKEGLHVVDTKGQYKYKVMNGNFSDISIDSNNTAVIDKKLNKVIFLTYEDDKWKSQHIIHFPEFQGGKKTLQFSDNNTVTVAALESNKILKVNIETGQVIKEYFRGSDVGQFVNPILSGVDNTGSVIVCDEFNHRFQVVDSSGKCHVVKSEAKDPKDVVIIGSNLYILHGVVSIYVTQYQIDN